MRIRVGSGGSPNRVGNSNKRALRHEVSRSGERMSCVDKGGIPSHNKTGDDKRQETGKALRSILIEEGSEPRYEL